MKIIKKIITLTIFSIGGFSFANIFYPEIGNKAKSFFSKPPLEKVSSQTEKLWQDVLGEEIKKEGEISQGEIVEQLKELPDKVSQQEIVEEVTQKVNQIIIEKVEEVKGLSEKQMEELKEDVRKQIHQEVCQEWLGEKKE